MHFKKTDRIIYKHHIFDFQRPDEHLKFEHSKSNPGQYWVDDFIFGGVHVEEEGTVQCFFPPAEEQGKTYLDPDAQLFLPGDTMSDSWRRQALEKESEGTLPVREHASRRRRLVELLR